MDKITHDHGHKIYRAQTENGRKYLPNNIHYEHWYMNTFSTSYEYVCGEQTEHVYCV